MGRYLVVSKSGRRFRHSRTRKGTLQVGKPVHHGTEPLFGAL